MNWPVVKEGKQFIKQSFIATGVNWYHHPMFHDNLYITAEWLYRKTHNTGFSSEISAGPGVSRTFLGGTTYDVNENGQISIKKLAGYYYALFTFGGGWGYDLSLKSRIPLTAFLKMKVIAMFPYNSTMYFRPVLELGVRFSPKNNSGMNR